jgi:hypothetical protein
MNFVQFQTTPATPAKPACVHFKYILYQELEKNLKMITFWEIAPFSLAEAHRRRPLKRQSTSTKLHGAISQNAVIFILAALIT